MPKHFPVILLAGLLALLSAPRAEGDNPRETVPGEPWPAVQLSSGTALRSGKLLIITLDSPPPEGRVTLAPLAAPLETLRWQGHPDLEPPVLQPGTDRWTLSWSPPAPPSPATLVAAFAQPLRLRDPDRVIPADADGSITLDGWLATPHGDALRYEPQPHKNTLGYWTNPNDWVHWQFRPKRTGDYRVHILQGCGTGQGGSKMRLSVGDQILPFTAEETGHFQNFRPVQLGQVHLVAGQTYRLEVRVEELAQKAAIDLRRVWLVPQSATPERPATPGQ